MPPSLEPILAQYCLPHYQHQQLLHSYETAALKMRQRTIDAYRSYLSQLTQTEPQPRHIVKTARSTFQVRYERQLEEFERICRTAAESYVATTTPASISSEKQERKERLPFKAEFTPLLENYFAKNAYPSSADRTVLAKKSGMTQRQIEVWFQNHRNRAKKEGRQLARLQSPNPKPPIDIQINPSRKVPPDHLTPLNRQKASPNPVLVASHNFLDYSPSATTYPRPYATPSEHVYCPINCDFSTPWSRSPTSSTSNNKVKDNPSLDSLCTDVHQLRIWETIKCKKPSKTFRSTKRQPFPRMSYTPLTSPSKIMQRPIKPFPMVSAPKDARSRAFATVPKATINDYLDQDKLASLPQGKVTTALLVQRGYLYRAPLDISFESILESNLINRHDICTPLVSSADQVT
uniref:HD2 homeodomain mating-type protein n=1 Tax=Volvariella volvacea TaxID=36659 RepID=G9I6E4_9AGAR|nr:HD2 homeodomain mating-type protein [Volvariella volvacea]